MAAARLVIIPARFASSRFPGKMLADATGRPLIQHVCEQATRAELVDRVVVATDDDRIRTAVESFGGTCVMTDAAHPNGTSRLAEAATALDLPDDAIVINVQGDEPELDPAAIDCAVRAIERDDGAAVATLACPFGPDDDAADPNLVKVVIAQHGRALYFSRAPIPFDRDAGTIGASALKHIGLYVYRRAFLRAYADLAPTPYERSESLEQLRVLEHGHAIAVGLVARAHAGIDTPAQYDAFCARVAAAEHDS